MYRRLCRPVVLEMEKKRNRRGAEHRADRTNVVVFANVEIFNQLSDVAHVNLAEPWHQRYECKRSGETCVVLLIKKAG